MLNGNLFSLTFLSSSKLSKLWKRIFVLEKHLDITFIVFTNQCNEMHESLAKNTGTDT